MRWCGVWSLGSRRDEDWWRGPHILILCNQWLYYFLQLSDEVKRRPEHYIQLFLRDYNSLRKRIGREGEREWKAEDECGELEDDENEEGGRDGGVRRRGGGGKFYLEVL